MVYTVFKTVRYEFLASHMPDYEAAIGNGTVGQFIDSVYARYARRFPIELPLSEDPSAEQLAAVDDNAPEPEHIARCLDDLPGEELAEEEAKITARQALIKKRKKQIASWFSYRYMKAHNCDPRGKDPSNPFTSLLFSLTGKATVEKPRQKSAVNCWSKSPNICNTINDEVYKICVAEGVRRNQSVSIWNRVAREQFGLLKQEEKERWEQKAKEEHTKEIEAWNALNEGRVSTKPEDRQQCIEGLIRLGQPIIEAMAEATGMNIALYAGGPEPANGGRLSIISLYASTNNSEDPLNFGQAERADIVKHIFPIFSRFLRNSFTPEECRRRALAPRDDLSALDNDAVRACGGSLDEAPVGPYVLDEVSDDPQRRDATNSTLFAVSPTNPAAAVGAASTSAVDNPVEISPATTSHSLTVMRAVSPGPVPAVPASLDKSSGPAPLQSATQLPITIPPPSPPGSAPVSPLGSPFRLPLGSPFRSPTRRDRSISDVSMNSTALPPTEPPALQATPSSPNDSSTTSPLQHPVREPRLVNGQKRKAQAPVSARPTKRVHDNVGEDTSAAPQPTSTPFTPTPESVANSPSALALQATHKWFAKAVEMLSDDTLGRLWVDLVAAWVAFEVKFECKPNGLLPCSGRPTAVGDWIARGRSQKWRPKIADSKRYGDSHEGWWMSLQPEWRVDDNGVWGAVESGSWDDLHLPGANGLLSVVASLFFWGMAVKAAGKKSRRWDELVVDTTNVLKQLSTSEAAY